MPSKAKRTKKRSSGIVQPRAPASLSVIAEREVPHYAFLGPDGYLLRDGPRAQRSRIRARLLAWCKPERVEDVKRGAPLFEAMSEYKLRQSSAVRNLFATGTAGPWHADGVKRLLDQPLDRAVETLGSAFDSVCEVVPAPGTWATVDAVMRSRLSGFERYAFQYYWITQKDANDPAYVATFCACFLLDWLGIVSLVYRVIPHGESLRAIVAPTPERHHVGSRLLGGAGSLQTHPAIVSRLPATPSKLKALSAPSQAVPTRYDANDPLNRARSDINAPNQHLRNWIIPNYAKGPDKPW